MPRKLTHLDKSGQARMVDVGQKAVTRRVAVAEATLRMKAETLALALSGDAPKGDVLGVARIAGIQAAKRTHELIPLCHQIPLSAVKVEITSRKPSALHVRAEASCEGRTGVEMEALVAATIASLTLYDMLKAVDRGMELSEVRLIEKSGGQSGTWPGNTHA